MSAPSREALVDAFERQIPACRDAGSELTARLMERSLEDLRAGGPVARLLAHFEGHPFLDAPCQRLLGAVQGLVLAGKAPELARHHPFAGGTPEWPALGDAFVAAIDAHLDEIAPRMARQVQTNEVRRCCGLLGGFLEIARETGLPLRLLEIGSSAGLILYWDRYRYELGPHRWGDPASPLTLRCDWSGPPPALDTAVEVASRRGCDIAPIDATDPEELRFIQSFYWADQADRMALLESAARALPGPAPVERIGAGDFVARETAGLPAGVATVLHHSTMWWYVPREEQERITAAMEAAGGRATAQAPLAWLRSEPPNLDCVEIRLRIWPG
ncbi:MAG: DUF2332 domain-containing protein, partial [Myxococcales bacterium]|nr:DUF2332 domain-containing protein [Myxococcales bacterium]